MITQPESNIKLSDDASKAIEEAKTRLFVIESEISGAKKILSGLKSEIERAVKEKAYQEEQLAEIESSLNPLKIEKTDLETSIAEKNIKSQELLIELNNLLDKEKEAKKVLEENESILAQRESYVLIKEGEIRNMEIEFSKKVEDFNIKLQKVGEVIKIL